MSLPGTHMTSARSARRHPEQQPRDTWNPTSRERPTHGRCDGESKPIMPKRVVIVGLGDAGVCAAAILAADMALEVVAISAKPCHQSGQELGGRLAQPAWWREFYLLPFSSYRKLDAVRIVHGAAVGVDLAAQRVSVQLASGGASVEEYDALLLCPGCTNGFWRTVGAPGEDRHAIEKEIQAQHGQIAAARVVAVVGSGPSGVSTAFNVARRFPEKGVHIFCSRDHVLPGYHPRVISRVDGKLRAAGVTVHAGHRASLPDGFTGERITSEPIEWSSGQPSFVADATVWALGMTRPNTAFVPPELLDEHGFIKVDKHLRAIDEHDARTDVFALGDVAATDPARSSARNNGWSLVAHNISASFGKGRMQAYAPPTYRWGSILGIWDGGGMEVFFATGRSLNTPLLAWKWMWPLVQRFLWGGMRNSVDWETRVK